MLIVQSESLSLFVVELPEELIGILESRIYERNHSNNPRVTCLETMPYFCMGDSDGEDVVLCTQMETFSVRKVQTSNTLLLVNVNQSQKSPTFRVKDIVCWHLELEQTPPRLDQLRALLERSIYAGAERERGPNEPLFGLVDLQRRVQASEGELVWGLELLEAVEIDGVFRLIDGSYSNNFLRYLMACVEVEDADINSLTAEFIAQCAAANDLADIVGIHCIRRVSALKPNGVYTILPDKVCRSIGQELLAQANGPIALHSFLKQWQRITPDPFETSINQLRGLYILTDYAGEAQIEFLSSSKLPFELKPRLLELFRRKPKWTLDEIKDFIEEDWGMAQSSEEKSQSRKNLTAKLLKYCRMVGNVLNLR